MSEDLKVRADDEHRARMQALKEQQDLEVRSKTIKRGVIVVNTGNGKGKSSSAFGMAIRAAGHGQRIGIVQFIKGTWKTGEQNAIKRFPEIDHFVCGDGFTWNTQNREQDVASARVGFVNNQHRAIEQVLLETLEAELDGAQFFVKTDEACSQIFCVGVGGRGGAVGLYSLVAE